MVKMHLQYCLSINAASIFFFNNQQLIISIFEINLYVYFLIIFFTKALCWNFFSIKYRLRYYVLLLYYNDIHSKYRMEYLKSWIFFFITLFVINSIYSFILIFNLYLQKRTILHHPVNAKAELAITLQKTAPRKTVLNRSVTNIYYRGFNYVGY